MRKTVFLLASLFVMVLATQRVNAQNQATAKATATIIQAISIDKVADLNFGNILAETDPETVTILTNGDRFGTGTPSPIPGTFNAAQFTVTGLANATYAITLPTSATITHTDGGATMTVTDFTSDPDGTGTLTGGTQTLLVGARLNVGANQVAGDYTGTFDVTVAYN